MESAEQTVSRYLASTGIGGFGPQADELIDEPWAVNPGRIVLAGLRGYASGFLALPSGDVPENHIERLALQAGSLAGFIGLGFPIFGRVAGMAIAPALVKFGIGANIGKLAGFRGIPMLAADKVLDMVSKGRMFEHLTEGAFKGSLVARQLTQTGIHIGTASFVSALHQGVGEAAVAGLHGMALGVVSGQIGNLPILKERTTMAAVLRAAAGGVSNIAMMGPGMEGAHWTDLAFQGVVGAYFGFTQPNAAYSRAHEWMRDLPRDAFDSRGVLAREQLFHDNPSFKALPEDVQEAVWKMSGLHDVEDVGTAISRFFGKHIDQKDPSKAVKRTYSDREQMLRTMAEMQRIWPSMSSSPTSLAPFVRRVGKLVDEGKAPFKWRDGEIGRMISSIGEKARAEGSDYPTFIENVKKGFSDMRIPFEDWKENDLFQFYNEKMTTVRKPVLSVMGKEEGDGPERRITYSFTPVSVRGRDTAGALLSDYGPVDQMMLMGKMHGLAEDPEGVYFSIDGYKPPNKRDKQDLSTQTELFTSLAIDPYFLATTTEDFSVPRLGPGRGHVQFRLLDENGKPRYYAMSGAAMKGRIRYARHFFRDNVYTEDQFVQFKNELAEKLALDEAKGKEVTPEIRQKVEADLEAALEKDKEMMLRVSQAGSDPVRIEKYTEAWKMSHVSNMNWFKAEQMSTPGKPWERPFSDVSKGQFVTSLSDYNKRIQPLMTSFPPLPKEVIPELRYVVAHDLKDYVQSVGDDGVPRKIDGEISDGATIVTREIYDSIASYMGWEPDGTSVKAFMLDDNPAMGLMIGKTALHVASEPMEAMMRESGINMVVFDSSAKQRGMRKMYAIRPGRRGLEFGTLLRNEKGDIVSARFGEKPEIHKTDSSKLFVSSSAYDKSHQGIEILKQMHNTVVWELVGRDEKYQFFRQRRERALSGMSNMERDVLEASVAGTREANTILRSFEMSGSQEDMKRLFQNDDSGRPLFESANPLRLLEALSKPGREKAFGEFLTYLSDKDFRGELVKSDDDKVTYYDDGEAESVLFSEQKSPADRMLALAAGRIGPLQHKSTYARLDTLISNWIVTKLTRPYHRFGAKSVMKPYDFGLMKDIGYDAGYVRILDSDGQYRPVAEGMPKRSLREDNFFMEGSAFRKYKTEFEGKARTLESLYNEYQQLVSRGFGESDRASKIRSVISSTSYRSPAVDPSAGRDLMLGGYSLGDRGYGILLHGKSMAAEGGADLDIDTTAIYWNLPESMRAITRSNKDGQEAWKNAEAIIRSEYGLPESWGRVNAFMVRPKEIISASDSATPADKLVGLFSSHQRVRLGLEVARGRNEFVSMAVSSRNIIHTLYSAINYAGRGKDRFTVDEKAGIEIEFEIRPDDGLRLRAMSDAATTAGVDVAKYGALIPQNEMVLSLMNSAFQRIRVYRRGQEVFELADYALRDPDIPGAAVMLHPSRQAYEFSREALALYNGTLDVGGVKVGLFTGSSPLGKIRRTNQALYGRNWDERRAWTLEERLSMIDVPDFQGGPVEGRFDMPSTLGSIARRLKEGLAGYTSVSPLAHMVAHFDNFRNSRRMFASSMKDQGAALWEFMYAGLPGQERDADGMFRFGGTFPALPFTSSGLEDVLATLARSGEGSNMLKWFDNLSTHRGRSRFASNNDAWLRFKEVVTKSGIYSDIGGFFKDEPANGDRGTFKWRMSKIWDLHRRITDFVSNDFDDMAALMTMRDYYHVSGLRREEANLLVRKAMSIRGRAADEFMKSRQTPEEDKAYREQMASSKARLLAKDEYYQYVEAGGLQAFVDQLNARRRPGEAEVSYDRAKDFFDSALLSPYKLSKEKDSTVYMWSTASRNFGMDTVPEGVMKTFVDNYSRLFDYTTSKPVDGEATLREFVENSPFIEAKQELNETIKAFRYTINPDRSKKISAEVEKEVAKLHELAFRFPVFQRDPKRLVDWLTKEHARVLDVTDLTLADIRSANRILSRWKSGTGILRWIMNKKHGESKAAQMLQPIAMSFFNPRYLGDQAMANDLLLVHRNTRTSPILVKHYETGPDGKETVRFVESSTTKAYSTMHGLTDIYGDQLPRLVASGHAAVVNDAMTHMKWLKGEMVLSRTGEDLTDLVMPFAIKRMEYDTAKDEGSTTAGQYEQGMRRAASDLRSKIGTPKGTLIEDEPMTWTSRSGKTVSGTLGELVREIGSSVQAGYAVVAERYISAKAWFDKNRDAILDASGRELRLENVMRRMEDVLAYGVAKDGHVPLDLGRFLVHEMMVEQVAAKRQKASPLRRLSSEELMQGGRMLALLERQGLLPASGVSRENLEAVALSLRKRAIGTKDANLQKELREAADYFHQKRDGTDMRDLWDKTPFRSGWMEDADFSTGRMTDAEYHRRRVREEYPLKTTELEKGFWPHMDFDAKIAKDHLLRWMKAETSPRAGHKQVSKEDAIRKAKYMRDVYNEILGRAGDPDARALDDLAVLHIEENPEAFLENFAENTSMLARRTLNLDGYRTDLGVIESYAQKLASASYGNIASMQARKLILDFEQRAPMGEWTGAWSRWFRIYVRDAMSKPSVFTQEYLDDEKLALKKTPYYYLTDHAMMVSGTALNRALLRFTKAANATDADRAVFELEKGRPMTPADEKELRDRRIEALTKIDGKVPTEYQAKVMSDRYRGMSELEAKYSMMSLLFHTKTITSNLLGGTTNAIIQSGLRNFVEAGKLETWKRFKPSLFETREDLSRWVAEQGVIEQWVINDLGSTPRYRTDKSYRMAIDRALQHLKKNPSASDESLLRVLRDTGLTEQLVNLAALPMRKSERFLRERAFLAGILQARKSMGPMALDIDHPFMIEMGRKAVGASQFLYDVANRPAMARTNFGKIWSRFKIWSWSSVAMRQRVLTDAMDNGFALHSESYQRMRRLAQADLFAVSLVSFFPFSIFETAGLPAPYNWLKDTAEYFFGDEKEKETAFYGSPIGPAAEVMPSIFTRALNAGDEIFDALVSDEKETLSRYPLVVMFPFGRMANDAYNAITDPMQAPKYLLGLPLRDLHNQREEIIRSNKLRETAPVLLRETIDGAFLKDIIASYEKEGYTATEARKAVNDGMKHGIIGREKRGNAYFYYTTADEKTIDSVMDELSRRSNVEFGVGDFMR